MKSMPLAEMCQTTFAEAVRSKFRVHASALTPVEVELVEATAHPSGQETAPAQARSFSLVFAGPLLHFLPQRTYLFEHEKLGAFDLFIVPIGKDQDGFRYEAVFNRPIHPDALAPRA